MSAGNLRATLSATWNESPASAVVGDVRVEIVGHARLRVSWPQVIATVTLTTPTDAVSIRGDEIVSWEDLRERVQRQQDLHDYAAHAARARELARKRASTQLQLDALTRQLTSELRQAAKAGDRQGVSLYRLSEDTTPGGHTNWLASVRRWVGPINLA